LLLSGRSERALALLLTSCLVSEESLLMPNQTGAQFLYYRCSFSETSPCHNLECSKKETDFLVEVKIPPSTATHKHLSQILMIAGRSSGTKVVF
jgi:hypothetical protein